MIASPAGPPIRPAAGAPSAGLPGSTGPAPGAPASGLPSSGVPGDAGPAAGRGGRDSLVHRALIYDSWHELALTAVPYLREGGRAGEPLVVIAAPPLTGFLRDRLGPATAAPVEFIDAADWFRGPMHALASYHDRTRADWWPRGRVRLLAEPVWAGRTPLETREWKRHEALLNVVFAGTPTSIMCAYDAAALPGHVLGDAARTHPELARPDGPRRSPRYTDPAEFSAECDTGALSPPPSTASRRAFAGGELAGLRAFLGAQADRHGLSEDRRLPFILAVNEVATDVIRESGGHGALWVWAEDGTLLCDVTDPCRILRDRFLGYTPPGGLTHRSGAAMWAVRRLCHIVEIRTGAAGTRIRLHTKL